MTRVDGSNMKSEVDEVDVVSGEQDIGKLFGGHITDFWLLLPEEACLPDFPRWPMLHWRMK